jgi:hypothetical protein
VFPVELNAMFEKIDDLISTQQLRNVPQTQCGRGKNIWDIFFFNA